MKRVVSWCLFVLAVAAGISVFLTAFFAYFVRIFDEAKRPAFDGLWRPLEPAPFNASFLFGTDNLWAGWFWFAVDVVWIFGGLALAYGLFRLAQHLRGG